MLIYSCSDLIFSTKIRSTAEVLQIESRPARNVGMLQARLDQVDDGKANGPVRCVMIDLELGEHAFEMIKAAAAFGGVEDEAKPPTVIAFAPHVMTGAIAGAERVGADLVFARGAFTARLPELITQYGS